MQMSSSLKPEKIEKAKIEVASLLKVLSNKVDLEMKFGANFIQFAPLTKSDTFFEDVVRSNQLDNTTNNDINKGRNKTGLSNAEKVEELKKLEEQVKECTKCDLCKNITNIVFGTGNPDADLMFVGEAPGHYEDIQGEPFVGRAGQLLTKIIESIDLKRSDVYIANILKCRPPGNRNPNADEIALCSPHLIKQIGIISPKIICALGTFAAQTLLDTKEPIGKLRGKFFEYQGTKFLATYHPAYLLRNPNDKKKVWADIKKVRDFLKKNSI